VGHWATPVLVATTLRNPPLPTACNALWGIPYRSAPTSGGDQTLLALGSNVHGGAVHQFLLSKNKALRPALSIVS
jgi:hypothetical protein